MDRNAGGQTVNQMRNRECRMLGAGDACFHSAFLILAEP
jgi:hypothetical protein